MSCICNGLQAADRSDRDRRSAGLGLLSDGCEEDGYRMVDRQ
jgi:hypothetical protein